MISNNYECLYSCYMKFENIAVMLYLVVKWIMKITLLKVVLGKKAMLKSQTILKIFSRKRFLHLITENIINHLIIVNKRKRI